MPQKTTGKSPEDEEETPETETEAAEEEETEEDGGGEDFDRQRAMDTIRAQRENEKKLEKRAKQAEKELKAYKDKEKAAQDADLSEVEQLRKEKTDLQTKFEQAHELAQGLRLESEFRKATSKAKLKFVDEQAENDAFELCDLEGVEIDADGKVTGLDDAIKKLKKTRSYLFLPDGEGSGGGDDKKSGTPTRNKRPTPAGGEGGKPLEEVAPLARL